MPARHHLRLEPTLVKVVLSLEPIVVMAAMAATAMSEAIRPYSMAVAPDSSLMKRAKTVFMAVPFMGLRVRLRAGDAGARSLEVGTDVGEGRVGLGADRGHGGDGGHGDERGDQAILDGGRAGLVLDEAGENGLHGSSFHGVESKASSRRCRREVT